MARSPEVLTGREAAKFLRLHVKTIYRLAKGGKVPGRKVGGDWRFHREELDKWLREGRNSL